MNERYRNGHQYNHRVLKGLWGEVPQDLRILESPKCISGHGRTFSHRVVDDLTGGLPRQAKPSFKTSDNSLS